MESIGEEGLERLEQAFALVAPQAQDFADVVDAVLSVTGSPGRTQFVHAEPLIGNTESCSFPGRESGIPDDNEILLQKVEVARVGSPLTNFQTTWRVTRGIAVVPEAPAGPGDIKELAQQARMEMMLSAAAVDDWSVLSTMLGECDVNEPALPVRILPESLVRRPVECSLLDVVFGSGAVTSARNLLELHGGMPSRETVMMALAIGHPDLVRISWQKLSGIEQERRMDFPRGRCGLPPRRTRPVAVSRSHAYRTRGLRGTRARQPCRGRVTGDLEDGASPLVGALS
jgi:hypothetical protein